MAIEIDGKEYPDVLSYWRQDSKTIQAIHSGQMSRTIKRILNMSSRQLLHSQLDMDEEGYHGSRI